MTFRDDAIERAVRHFIPLAPRESRRIVASHAGSSIYRALTDQTAPEGAQRPADIVCHANNEIWELIIHNGLRRSDVTITLDSFFLFEWFPRSPGLFHTHHGWQARQNARHQVAQFLDGTVVFDPYGKASMLDGGVGALRFAPIEFLGKHLYLMTASSSGICHEGFPLAVPEHLYDALVGEIQERGTVVRSITGRMRFVPERLRPYFADSHGVPRLFLSVEDISTARHPKRRSTEELRVSVAVSFVSSYEDPDRQPKVYASYVTFNPADPKGLADAVEWLEEAYVRNNYCGRVVTDFDEQVGHFPNAPFALEKVMQLRLVGAEVAEVASIVAIDADGILRQQATIKEVYLDSKYKILGGQQGAVGDNAQATHVSQSQIGSAAGLDLQAISEELSRLRASARSEANLPEHDEAVGALASAETAARKGDGTSMLQNLARAGQWALDLASKIGVTIAAEALKRSLGLK